ncbi:uncharacterized protein LOC141858713 [Brevipalpus obovatus]|uniref:uncharacterized protein LOC141858713 n=1 Tax=Brevipalpus obovatus TaxID=246614 RepID=UPI003D9EB437
MNSSAVKTLLIRRALGNSVCYNSVRGKKIQWPVSGATPAVEWNGKVYRKLYYCWTETPIFFHLNWKEVWQRQYFFRFWVYGACLTFPIVCYIHSLVNSKENKAFWDAKRKADLEALHKHEWDL